MAETKYELDVELVQRILDYMGKKPYAEVRNIMIPLDAIVMKTNAKVEAEKKDK